MSLLLLPCVYNETKTISYFILNTQVQAENTVGFLRESMSYSYLNSCPKYSPNVCGVESDMHELQFNQKFCPDQMHKTPQTQVLRRLWRSAEYCVQIPINTCSTPFFLRISLGLGSLFKEIAVQNDCNFDKITGLKNFFLLNYWVFSYL